jgi:hypothetical protein
MMHTRQEDNRRITLFSDALCLVFLIHYTSPLA